jgi:hypothetical protein
MGSFLVGGQTSEVWLPLWTIAQAMDCYQLAGL